MDRITDSIYDRLVLLSNVMPLNVERAAAVFRRHRGVLRTSQAVAAGVHPRTLYAMRDAGVVEQLGRGLYRLAGLPPLGNPDLVVVAAKVRSGVVCLISALAFHELTTQVPHEVHVALPKGAEPPRLDYPPVRPVWFGGAAHSAGVATHTIDGVPVRVYTPEKTLADCFKFRNRIGLDVCLEALRLYRQRRTVRVDDLLAFARVCRVERVMRPYLESIL
jgi:predicted transcriptional regulator of viral defense system